MAYDAKEWYRQMYGIIDKISNLSDQECRKIDAYLDNLEAQQKIKNITL